jgi:hypothetical protein
MQELFVNNMKYETLHHTAKQIDHLINHYIHSRGSQFLPQEELKKLILKDFPDFYVRDFGWHKIVFGINKIDQIVLKVGAKKSIENDHSAYKRVPEGVRHQLFARIFWHTKFCLLQQYGSPAKVSAGELNTLRAMVYKYGVFDIKAENLRRINGDLKIIDANATPFPLPTVWKMVDEVKPKFPDRLMLFIKKLAKPIYER